MSKTKTKPSKKRTVKATVVKTQEAPAVNQTAGCSREEYSTLVQEALEHCRLYYCHGSPSVTDADYDKLVGDIRNIEATHPDWTLPESPTQRVTGGYMGGFEKVAHVEPMLSLSNLHDSEDVRRFLGRFDGVSDDVLSDGFVIEPKVDGLSIELRFEDGLFVQALTRGTGSIGEDVTAQVRTIRNLPLRLHQAGDLTSSAGSLRVRGEVYMSFQDFKLVNDRLIESGEDPMANPRNAAVGTLKLTNLDAVSRRRLSVVCYEVLGHPELSTTVGMRNALAGWGLPTLSVYSLLAPANQNVLTGMLEVINISRPRYPFATDGAVIKLNNRAGRSELGQSSHSPRWAAAYKFPPTQVETILLGVTTQVGRLGTMTPVANVKPVHVDGTTVRNASLCNWQEIERLDVRAGDTVVLVKAGEIIPKVIAVRHDLRKGHERVIEKPAFCASCGSPVQPDTEDAVAIRCTGGTVCPATSARRLEYAVSKDVLNVMGMGPSVLSKLQDVASKLPQTLPELFKLSQEDFLEAGFSSHQADKLLASLRAARDGADQAKLLMSFSIPKVGDTASRALISRFGSLTAAMAAPEEQVRTDCPDLQAGPAEAFLEWRAQPDSAELVAQLEAAGFDVRGATASEPQSDKLKGQTWVITGTLSQERGVFEAIIRKHGGKVGSSVSKRTHGVLAGDKAGSKLDKARENKVKVYTEAEFLKLTEG